MTVSLAVIALLVVIVSVPAGGTSEPASESETTGTDEDELRARRQELLSSIGIRVFDDRLDAVDFDLESLAEESLSLGDFRGDFVFLNFWATWCPPCREEMPAMEVMQEELADLPFTILAVSVQEDRGTVERFIQEFGFTFPILLDPAGRVTSRYGVRGLPTTFIIDPDGTVLGMLIGILDWKDESVLSVFRRMITLDGA